MMNQAQSGNGSMGYLIVKVSTARGAIPLEDATVVIRGGTPESSGVLYSLRTDRDGKTPQISLPTPPRSMSQTPGGGTPYSTYQIEVFKEGYVPLAFENVPVFPSIVSIQPAIMVPSPEYYGDALPYSSATVIPPEDADTAL